MYLKLPKLIYWVNAHLHYLPQIKSVAFDTWCWKLCSEGLVSWCLACCHVTCSLESLPFGLVPPPGWGVQFLTPSICPDSWYFFLINFTSSQFIIVHYSVYYYLLLFINFSVLYHCCLLSHTYCGMLSYYIQISSVLYSFKGCVLAFLKLHILCWACQNVSLLSYTFIYT